MTVKGKSFIFYRDQNPKGVTIAPSEKGLNQQKKAEVVPAKEAFKINFWNPTPPLPAPGDGC
jgi:hypothetical protein